MRSSSARHLVVLSLFGVLGPLIGYVYGTAGSLKRSAVSTTGDARTVSAANWGDPTNLDASHASFPAGRENSVVYLYGFPFSFMLKPAHPGEAVGTVLYVYREDRHQHVLAMKQRFEDDSVTNTIPWFAFGPEKIDATGFILEMSPPMGSGSNYSIYAEIGGKIREVFRARRVRQPLEMVYLDKHFDEQDNPEIVTVGMPKYSMNPNGIANVWKWSFKRKRYVHVRACRYEERFRPLSAQESVIAQ